ncbi:MAG: glutamine amidotransferase, class [Ilumatobacteraceae bacterium]|nr:glutamine amidotransferase, class [Ilumatobacteraceae bacterium]
MSTPLVIVPTRRADAGRASRHPAVFAVQPAIDALRRAGAEVWLLPPAPFTATEADALLARASGLCLQGGADVGSAAVQDDAEMALTRAAIALGVPVLGLCRGAQLLNVVRGGTLTDLAGVDAASHHPVDAPGAVGVVHDVRIVAGSRLHDIVGAGSARVSSVHHQAIDRLGDGLLSTAVAPDGTTEAIELAPSPEHGDAWVLGVQWHPEDTAADDPIQQRLFDRFVAACL